MKDIEPTQVENSSKKALTNPRRQFFKKAAVGSALLTTISSRPVWAVGCTVSGQMSGNLSNPDRDDCTAQATGKSPGYWKGWRSVYNFLNNHKGIKWADMSTSQKNKFKFNGEGNSINVLFNWVVASNNSGGKIQYPAINGVKTNMGAILADKSNDLDYNYCAALLSAAHPKIHFPYPSNKWTLQYLIDNHKNSETITETRDLVADFFHNHLEPAGLQKYSGRNKRAAFNWAKDILGM
jgi:hypothetical protein